MSLLVKLGRIRLQQPFGHWMDGLLSQRGFDLAPLDPQVISVAMGLGFTEDPFDAAIVATALAKGLPLITRDREITRSKVVEIAW